jgi:hypothetical protein
MRTKFTLTQVLPLPCTLGFAQTKPIKERVTDHANQTMMGVSILLKDTGTASTTDVSGTLGKFQ